MMVTTYTRTDWFLFLNPLSYRLIIKVEGIPNSTAFRVLLNIGLYYNAINGKLITQFFFGAFWGNKVINVLNVLKPSEYCKPSKYTCISFILSGYSCTCLSISVSIWTDLKPKTPTSILYEHYLSAREIP